MKEPGIPSHFHGQSGEFFSYKTTYQGSGVVLIFGFHGIRFPGPTEVRQARLETQAFGRSLLPLETSKRRAARGTAAQVLQFALDFRPIHVFKPIRGSRERSVGKRRTLNCKCPLPQTTPAPFGGAAHQAGTHGIALHVAQHREKMVTFRRALYKSLAQRLQRFITAYLMWGCDFNRCANTAGKLGAAVQPSASDVF